MARHTLIDGILKLSHTTQCTRKATQVHCISCQQNVRNNALVSKSWWKLSRWKHAFFMTNSVYWFLYTHAATYYTVDHVPFLCVNDFKNEYSQTLHQHYAVSHHALVSLPPPPPPPPPPAPFFSLLFRFYNPRSRIFQKTWRHSTENIINICCCFFSPFKAPLYACTHDWFSWGVAVSTC